jgi:heme-degrading monooxygenase HmoA
MSNQVPLSEAPVDQPVTLINAFTVPLHESDRFLRWWKDNARIMAGQPGFIRARMYKSLVEDAELRFINMAEWSSGEALAKARANPEFLTSVRRLMDDPELHVMMTKDTQGCLKPMCATSLDEFPAIGTGNFLFQTGKNLALTAN